MKNNTENIYKFLTVIKFEIWIHSNNLFYHIKVCDIRGGDVEVVRTTNG